MKKIHHYHRRFRLSMLRANGLALVACAFLLPSYVSFEKEGDNYFTLLLNGVAVGNVGSEEAADSYFMQARGEIASEQENNDLVFIDTELNIAGSEVIWGEVDSRNTVVSKMKEVMRNNTMETLHRSYTVKINESTVNLASYEDVHTLLESALAQYDTEKEYEVNLVLDDAREVNVLTTQIEKKEETVQEEEMAYAAGVEYDLEEMLAQIEPEVEKGFDEYSQGLVSISFADMVEVVEAYLLEDQLMPVEQAVNLLTKEQETQVIYKIVSGDTLSEIALTHNIPLADLVEMNDALEDENSTIRVDQELIITVPEPELSIIWQEEQIYEESYDEQIQYVDNDQWYTTQTETLQQPSAGLRKVVAVTTYKNGEAQERELLKEEVYAQAIPKIVERGTIIPPTYIKPLSGGRLSSGFGARSAPTAGASSNHRGVDWATPIGTPVVASNTGTVVTAGWVSGYGYAVYINHSDGRQTRYGHLSKVLVKVGQTVTQGQQIALSGNTGRSTGPHVHFEIRINGTAVNPLNHLN